MFAGWDTTSQHFCSSHSNKKSEDSPGCTCPAPKSLPSLREAEARQELRAQLTRSLGRAADECSDVTQGDLIETPCANLGYSFRMRRSGPVAVNEINVVDANVASAILEVPGDDD